MCVRSNMWKTKVKEADRNDGHVKGKWKDTLTLFHVLNGESEALGCSPSRCCAGTPKASIWPSERGATRFPLSLDIWQRASLLARAAKFRKKLIAQEEPALQHHKAIVWVKGSDSLEGTGWWRRFWEAGWMELVGLRDERLPIRPSGTAVWDDLCSSHIHAGRPAELSMEKTLLKWWKHRILLWLFTGSKVFLGWLKLERRPSLKIRSGGIRWYHAWIQRIRIRLQFWSWKRGNYTSCYLISSLMTFFHEY